MPRKVSLHARDIEVMELLAERQVDTLDALHERFWPGGARKSAYNRLGRLAKAGYLRHVPRAEPATDPKGVGRPAAQHLYLLGPKASTALRLRGRPLAALARRAATGLPDRLVDHQLATNRVSDHLGTRLMTDTQAGSAVDRKQRPDGAYRALPDAEGRELVLVEVDLGHYTRQRILDKASGFLAHPDARSILFASPTDERADQVAGWIRDHYGSGVMSRIQILSFDQLARGVALDEGTEPLAAPQRPGSAWYATHIARPGSR